MRVVSMKQKLSLKFRTLLIYCTELVACKAPFLLWFWGTRKEILLTPCLGGERSCCKKYLKFHSLFFVPITRLQQKWMRTSTIPKNILCLSKQEGRKLNEYGYFYTSNQSRELQVCCCYCLQKFFHTHNAGWHIHSKILTSEIAKATHLSWKLFCLNVAQRQGAKQRVFASLPLIPNLASNRVGAFAKAMW